MTVIELSKTILTSLLTMFLVSTLLASGCRMTWAADPATLYVPSEYPTIQEAINHANPGDTVFVHNRTYYENIVINKSVSLVGEDRDSTIIDGQEAGTVISVTTNGVTISGFTIQKSTQGLYNSGIYIDHSSNNSITHNSIEANYHGIYLLSSNNNDITNNRVTANNFHGIYLVDSMDNVLSGNNASFNVNDGISLHSSHGNTISYNNASSNQNDGIYLYSSNDNIITQNEVASNSYHGVHFHSSSDNVISNNHAVFNENNGVYLDHSVNNVIFDCELSRNTLHGIYVFLSNNNYIFSNNISKNEYGVRLYSFSSNNTFYHNNFLQNKNQVWSESANEWNDAIGGNYWSDYTGQDLDRDGLGDTPYVIDANNRDPYPLMGVFRVFTVIWKERAYGVNIVSNSQIALFGFAAEAQTGNKMVSFTVTGEEGALGFCRVMVPTDLTPYSLFVLVDGEEVPTIPLEVPEASFIGASFTYLQGDHSVTIIASKLLHLYNQLLAEYSSLQTDYGNLTSAYHELLVGYAQLLAGYGAMNTSLQSLLQAHSEIEAEYAALLSMHSQNIQSLVYIFLATTVPPFGCHPNRHSTTANPSEPRAWRRTQTRSVLCRMYVFDHAHSATQGIIDVHQDDQ